ncbi:MAG: hypothetical protein ABSC94_16235 [Polyangiaceae bacterium]|jgi:hypothetical protein
MTRLPLLALVGFFAFFTPAASAHADDTIKRPGAHPLYSVELEPHGLFGWGDTYGTAGGFGIGGRVGIPIVQNGFVPTINNSVAISFGLDWVHYGCYDSLADCSADFIEAPVTMQWNFYVSQRWSVFGEPGLYIYHGWYTTCRIYPENLACGAEPEQTGVLPALFLGARFHFSDKAALTMRVGYPTLSVGVSFFP